MSIAGLLIVGRDPLARAAALSAARTAYPSARLIPLNSITEAKDREWLPNAEILLLLRPSSFEIEEALQTRDPRGLPRWPVVVFGDAQPARTVQVVRPEDWNSRMGAKILASAAAVHELACENARLRGDLRTLGNRVSHDLRTPLNCVSLAGEALRKLSPDPASQQSALSSNLVEAVAEVAVTVERVSFVLKATANPPPPHPVAMKNVVWAALQRLETRTRKRDATVAQPEDWPNVEGVASWLEVIWENLIANSLIHGDAKPQVELGWSLAPSEYRFHVRDNGVGVPQGKRSRLFMPFDLLHELNAPRGLGLPIVQRLVELQHGRCFYEAPADGGASFFFTLPAQR